MTPVTDTPDTPPTFDEATAMLAAPGSFFETAVEEVLGEPMAVFVQRPRTMAQVLMAGRAHADKDYVVFHDGAIRRALTFTEHEAQVAAMAAALAERGVGKGDRVAVLAANCPEYIVVFWACATLGAVTVCFNGWWTGDEIRYGLELTEPDLLVADRKRLARLDGADPGVPLVVIEDDVAGMIAGHRGAELPDAAVDEDDPAVVQFTSGTTGRPKAAIISHRSLVGFVMLSFFLGARDMLLKGNREAGATGARLAVFPLFHLSGLQSSTITSMMGGVTTVWPMGRFDPALVVRLTTEENITAWNGTATHILRLLAEPGVTELPPGQVGSVGIGGSATSPELIRATEARFPHTEGTFATGYGLTESGGLVSYAPNSMLSQARDTVGPPLPTVEVRIVGEDGAEVPDGEHGDICVRSPLVMLEYWNDPGATAEALLSGRWLRTGDFGRMEDGRLHIASRMRDLILRGGENVYPVEVEQRLEAHPAVVEAAVVGADHPVLGQEVKAIVVTADGADCSADDLIAHCAEVLAYYKVPSIVEFRDEPLPRNATGKVVKAVLTGDAAHTFVEE